MPVLISLAMAIAPALILVVYYYRQDRRKPEPKGLIVKVFLFGILSTIPAILLELAVSTLEDLVSWWRLLYYLFEAFVVAAICEELIKLWVVKTVAYNNVHFDEISLASLPEPAATPAILAALLLGCVGVARYA